MFLAIWLFAFTGSGVGVSSPAGRGWLALLAFATMVLS